MLLESLYLVLSCAYVVVLDFTTALIVHCHLVHETMGSKGIDKGRLFFYFVTLPALKESEYQVLQINVIKSSCRIIVNCQHFHTFIGYIVDYFVLSALF